MLTRSEGPAKGFLSLSVRLEGKMSSWLQGQWSDYLYRVPMLGYWTPWGQHFLAN